jgi:hypothetical protein
MRRRLAVPAVLFLAAASPVAADIDKGLYFGGGVGNAGVEVSDPAFELDDSDNGWKAIVGWRIFKFLAVEANWVDFGTSEESMGGTDVGVSTDGYDVSALGIWTLGDHFELFLKGGYVSWDSETDSSNPSLDSQEDGEDLVYGAGGAVRLGESFQIRAEYERFEIEDTDTVDLASASFTFTF